jgi:hypothetical protein
MRDDLLRGLQVVPMKNGGTFSSSMTARFCV